MPETNRPLRLDSSTPLREIVDGWATGLAQVLESMTDRKPEIRWQAASGAAADARAAAGHPGADSELLWWEQHFHIAPGMTAWIAAPRSLWEYCGTLTLKAAGLETVEAGEARNTWLEILGQSLGGVARSLTSLLGREVTCETGSEHIPEPQPQEWAAVAISFGEEQLPTLLLALSPSLTALIATPPSDEADAPGSAAPPPAAEAAPPERSRTMDLLLDVDLPISISFGRTRLPMKDVLKLTTGSIVELNRGVNDPVEVLVNSCLIARGEVVVVEGNYGVRIQEIANRQDRLRSMR
ncbi:MAG TPA: flagellar motor switch protein FliN [Candidatus Sulfopaludibacter sp.]|nr:flagellar motor switch protein FliN [Candidatus Sulfopaludibacter sp.]